MSRTNIHSGFAVLMVVGLTFLGSCKKEEPNQGCGNGLLGIGEACDCGTDPNHLPVGCTAINGVLGGTCTEDCRLTSPEICRNGNVDDDGDGLADCDDPDCASYPACLPEICDDGVDNNGDGALDCDDEDCVGLTICETEICTGGVDENENGKIDCQDAQCLGAAECDGVEVCWNNLDDNGDGRTDCEDPACDGPEFEQFCAPEDCGNGVDDNYDFKVDCADSDCIEVDQCALTGCGPEDVDDTVTLSIPGGAMVVRRTVDVAGNTDDHTGQCDVTGGKEYVLAINVIPEAGELGRLRVRFHQTGDHKFGLYFKGGPEAGCTAALGFGCVDQQPNTSGVLEYGSLPESKYFLVIAEGMVGAGGEVELVLTLADPNNVEELCDNELDDDANGQLDCGDLGCFEEPGVCDFSGCVAPGQVPVPDFEAGSLDGSAIAMSPRPPANPYFALDTRGESADYQVSCLPFGGGDQLVRFELTEEAFVQVGYKQDMTNAGNHVVGLFFAGNGCELAEHHCEYTAGALQGVVEFPGDPALGGKYPPGEYYVVVKAANNSEGRVNIQIMALDSQRELCGDDGYDNDGNGYANCDEPGQPGACDGHHLCILEDCSDPVADLDGDGKPGCTDDDPDDYCACSYACACTQPCLPEIYVCDWRYDPGVTNLGTFYVPNPNPVSLNLDTSHPSESESYVLNTCHGDVNYVQPDHVVWFELAYQANVDIHFTQPTGADHVGAVLMADRCRACDDRGPSGQYHIYCYANASPWSQSALPPGAYVLIVKPRVDINGTVLSGQINLDFVIN